MSLTEDIFEAASNASMAAHYPQLLREADKLRAENTRLRIALTAIMDDVEGINPELRALGYIPCVIMKTNLARGSAALKSAALAHLEK